MESKSSSIVKKGGLSESHCVGFQVPLFRRLQYVQNLILGLRTHWNSQIRLWERGSLQPIFRKDGCCQIMGHNSGCFLAIPGYE